MYRVSRVSSDKCTDDFVLLGILKFCHFHIHNRYISTLQLNESHLHQYIEMKNVMVIFFNQNNIV